MMEQALSLRWKRIPVIIAGLLGLSTLSFNCAPSLFEAKKGGGGSMFDTFSVFEATNAPITLLTAEQTYQSMLNVTGQTAAPVARAEYLSRFGTMSSTPNLTNMNSPLMLASTSLAGDICGSLINAEANSANRRFFANVNFGAAPDLGSFQSSVAVLSEAFWGRPINNEELAIFGSYFTEMTSGAPQNGALTTAVTLGACAAMLSSFESLVY